MKRFACLVLVVLLVALMAVPVFSSVYRPNDRVGVLSTFSKAKSFLGDDLVSKNPYYSVLTYGTNVQVMFFPTPVVTIDTPFYCVRRNDKNYTLLYYNGIRVVDSSLNFGYKERLDGVGYVQGYHYVVSDLSTVTYSDIVNQGDHDWHSTIFPSGLSNVSIKLYDLIEASNLIIDIGYDPSSWSAFQDALQASSDLLGQSTYTRRQIDDSYAALLSAKDSLSIFPSVSDLESLLIECVSLPSGSYTPSSYSVLQSAIQDAESVLSLSEYTQEQVDSAYDALLSAKSSLVELPDTTDLESLLAACKALLSGSYTFSSWSALQSAIQDAEAVLALPEYTESDIDQAYAALESAHGSLVLLPDTSDLESLLTECKAISVDSYTAKSFAALQSAIKQAENLLAQLEYTESDLADAILFLQNAKDNLIELSASDAALRQNLLLFVDILLSNIAVILPIGIIILGIILCVLLLPRILYKFFK